MRRFVYIHSIRDIIFIQDFLYLFRIITSALIRLVYSFDIFEQLLGKIGININLISKQRDKTYKEREIQKKKERFEVLILSLYLLIAFVKFVQYKKYFCSIFR